MAKTLKQTYTQTRSAGPCRGGSDRIPFHVCGEGESGEKQGEKKWWEGDRRERKIGEKRGEGKRWEDDMRESPGTRRRGMGKRWEGEGGGDQEGS